MTSAPTRRSSFLRSPLGRGLVVAAVFGVGFALLAVAALGEGPMPELDSRIALTMRELSENHPGWRNAMVVLTHVGGIPALTGLALLLAVWEVWRKHLAAAIACALIPLTGALFDVYLKNSFDRERPPPEWRDPAVTETNESFPSGHSMGSMVGFGVLGFVLLGDIKKRRIRLMVVIGLVLLILAIGFSRIYLRAHWFSDVLAGFAIGMAWLGLGLGWLAHHTRLRDVAAPERQDT